MFGPDHLHKLFYSLETRDAGDICLSSNFSVLDCPVPGNAIKTRHRFFFAIPTSIAAIIAFLLCQVVIVLVPPVVQRSSFLAGAIEKHKLLSTTPSPRLILVGGSNVAFGFDSEYLSRVLKLPVINMALHGGLGLRFALNEVAPYIRKNDLIVVAPEYPQFDDPNGDLTLLQLLSVYPLRISRHDGHAFHGNVATCFSHRGHLFHNEWPGATLKHIPQIRTVYSGI